MSFAPQSHSAICIRPAQPSDKDAVLAFCSNTWDDQEDYIDSVWDRWLAAERSILLVATLNEMPVAMGRGLLMGDREAWLEGIRVERQYRRQGIFRQLEVQLYDRLQAAGARICRTCIASNNKVMTAIGLRSHYRVVTPYSIYSGPSDSSSSISSPDYALYPSAESEINQWNERQSTAPLYVCRGAKWQALTTDQLSKLQQLARLWSFHYNGIFSGLFVQSEMENPDGSLWVGLCDVWSYEAVFYGELRRLSARLGFQTVRGFFPANVELHTNLLRAGYQRSINFQYIVYQRQLG
ncbi:MAG: GNAT family N-acetyltransferase [Cyanobacteria bacterium P01_E01_bin.34]